MAVTTAPAGTPTPPSKGFRIDIERPYDSAAERGRKLRWVNLIVTLVLVVLAPVLLLSWWGSFIGPASTKVGLLAGLGVAGYLVYLVLGRLLVSNPEWGAYMTLDAFTGQNVPYGPGLHPSYWWEQRNKDGNYSLEVVTKVSEISVPTKDARLAADFVFEYQVDLPNIQNNVGIDESTIDDGFTGFIQSFLTVELADKTAEEGRRLVSEFNRKLADRFMGIELAHGETITEFEKKNGIRAVAAFIKGLRFSEGVQQTRDAVDKGKVIFGIVAEMLGLSQDELRAKRTGTTPAMSDKQYDAYVDQALALSGNADMKIVKGNVGAALADNLFGGPKGRRGP